jgi:hypothetical protein
MKIGHHRYVIVQQTQHWTIRNGRTYRDVVARRDDGQLRLVLVPA